MSKETAMQAATGTQSAPPPIAPPVETPVVPDAPAQQDAERFAKLAAQEARIVKERSEFKLEQQRLYEEVNKARKVNEEYQKFQELKEKDKLGALKAAGFSDTDIFNALADHKEPTPEELAAAKAEEIVNAKVKELEDKVLAKEQAEIKRKDDLAIGSFKVGISKTIEKEAEKYEFCAFKGKEASDLVYETVLAIIKEEPELPPHEAMKDAIELVEENYRKEDEEMGKKLKSRQPKVEVAPLPEKPQRTRAIDPQSRPAPTITNKATATVASTATKKETPSEKRERIIENIRAHGLTK